jgi:hypothetical protein
MEKRLIDYKDLNRKDKIDHIWEYYKIHIIGSIIGLLIVFWLLNHYIFNPPADIVLDMSIFTYSMNDETRIERRDQLSEIVSDDLKREVAAIESFNIEEGIDYNMQMANVTKIMGKSTLGEFDIFVFVGENFQMYLEQGLMKPIDSYIEQGLINLPEEAYFSAEDLGLAGEGIASDSIYLADVTELEFFDGLLPEGETYYLGVFVSTSQEENIEKVFDYMFE